VSGTRPGAGAKHAHANGIPSHDPGDYSDLIIW
jgi:hypothetical protein